MRLPGRLVAGVAGIVGAGLAARLVLTTADVVGNSMSPTLADGQRVLVIRTRWRPVRTGQLVVFANPLAHAEPRYLVKRVVAIAGQRSPIDGQQVPAGRMVVRGDNPHSMDSRRLGPIELSSVLGSALGRYPAPAPGG